MWVCVRKFPPITCLLFFSNACHLGALGDALLIVPKRHSFYNANKLGPPATGGGAQPNKGAAGFDMVSRRKEKRRNSSTITSTPFMSCFPNPISDPLSALLQPIECSLCDSSIPMQFLQIPLYYWHVMSSPFESSTLHFPSLGNPNWTPCSCYLYPNPTSIGQHAYHIKAPLTN